MNIMGPGDLDSINYSGIATAYGITINPPFSEEITEVKQFDAPSSHQHNQNVFSEPQPPNDVVNINSDYETVSVYGSYEGTYRSTGAAQPAFFSYDIEGVSESTGNMQTNFLQT